MLWWRRLAASTLEYSHKCHGGKPKRETIYKERFIDLRMILEHGIIPWESIEKIPKSGDMTFPESEYHFTPETIPFHERVLEL